MDRPMQLSSDLDDQVHSLAGQMRQALQTCSVHSVGPVAAFERCTSALEDGRINFEQFQEIGRRIVYASNERIRVHQTEEDPEVRLRKITRETRLVSFVEALFSLDLDSLKG